MESNYEIFRFEDNVPQIYVDESRDFQMMLRLLTFGLTSSKYEAELSKYVNNPDLCPDSLLLLLMGKIGFFPLREYSGEQLRCVAKCFQDLVRRKGTKKAILEAVQLYFQSQDLNTAMYLNIKNEEESDTSFGLQIDIGIKANKQNTDLLTDILRYILPTGYVLNIFFYNEIKFWSEIPTQSNVYLFIHEGADQSIIYKKFEAAWTKKIPSMQNIIVGSNTLGG